MSFNPKWIVGKTVERVHRETDYIAVHFTDGSYAIFGGRDNPESDPPTLAYAEYVPARGASAPGQQRNPK